MAQVGPQAITQTIRGRGSHRHSGDMLWAGDAREGQAEAGEALIHTRTGVTWASAPNPQPQRVLTPLLSSRVTRPSEHGFQKSSRQHVL